MPRAVEIIPDSEDEIGHNLESENLCLHLPSDFSFDNWQRLCVVALAATELKLWKGEANNSIQQLRTQINFKLGLDEQKKKGKVYEGADTCIEATSRCSTSTGCCGS
jgi:hypothetical protein